MTEQRPRLQAAFSEVREALRNYGTWRMQKPYRVRADTALARIESEVARLERIEEALEKIASCEQRIDGDVVSIARQALAAEEGGDREAR